MVQANGQKGIRQDFVSSRQDVINNIIKLYEYLIKGTPELQEWAKKRLQKGKQYVVEIINGEIKFTPSRFVGYADNSFEKHSVNHGDGLMKKRQR